MKEYLTDKINNLPPSATLSMAAKARELKNNGIDIIEIGMPFSDPMADGPTIQLSSARAIKQGVNLTHIF